MSSNSFPVKILAVTSKQSASEDAAYDELDKIVDDNPLSEIITVAEGGYFPDMTKAVRMTNAIYRVNVPGYFYHHVKNPAVSGSKGSGIIISCYPTLIDSYVGLVQKEHKCVSYGGGSTGTPTVNRTVNTFGTNLVSRSYSKKADVDIRKPDGALIKKASAYVACVVNQRYAETNKNAYRTTYVVNTGVNKTGCLANNMIPIVPGAGPSNEMFGISGIIDTNNVIIGCKQVPAGGSGGKYETDDGATHSTGGTVYIHPISEKAVFEGRGTYVYWYKPDEYDGTAATDSSDEFLFVPCVGIKEGCHPLTKIRDCSRRFLPNIPSGGKVELDISIWHKCHDEFDDHSDLMWVVLKTKAEGLGSPENATITINPKRQDCTTVKEFLYLNWTDGLHPASGECKYKYTVGTIDKNPFAHAFYGQSLKPRIGKFFVQWPFKLPPVASEHWPAAKIYPSNSPVPSGNVSEWGSSSYWAKCVTQYFKDLTQFDPTVNDENTSRTILPKYSIQKDLPYD